MSRPTSMQIDVTALLHNVRQVRRAAPGTKLIAMVKANAYGCGINTVLPTLSMHVDALGVACLEEAIAVRRLGINTDCVLFQGLFSPDECAALVNERLQCVIHHTTQLKWILASKLTGRVKVWIKVDTGMHRLGFLPEDVDEVVHALQTCSWVDPEIGLMTHFACADEPENAYNALQWQRFQAVCARYPLLPSSVANSAAILTRPEVHAQFVRPGIMLYGASPFLDRTGQDLGLRPVMRLVSKITAWHVLSAHEPVGYGGTWQSEKPSRIGVVPVGYGDGYPRSIEPNTPVWINHRYAPIVGRVSMDMLTVDLTHHPEVKLGDEVELWGPHVPVEVIARSAKTIPYDLLCRVSPRVRGAS